MLETIGQAFKGVQRSQLWETCVPKDSYEVVVLGGGTHGLACAYYLVKEFGVQRVAVLERRELGAMESPWLTPLLGINEPVPWAEQVYNTSQTMYQAMAADQECKVDYIPREVLCLASDAREAGVFRGVGEAQRLRGEKKRFLTNAEVKKKYPALVGGADLSGALYQPSSALLRPAAVAWNYAALAGRVGVDLCPGITVEKLEISENRVLGLWTDRGHIRTGMVLSTTADWGGNTAVEGMERSLVAKPYGVWVSENTRPSMNTVVQCGGLYIGQGRGGAWYLGGSEAEQVNVGPVATWAGTLLPELRSVTFLHHWHGYGYYASDGKPIIGPSAVEGLFTDLGWGARAFEAAPACGRFLAAWLANGQPPDMWPGLIEQSMHAKNAKE